MSTAVVPFQFQSSAIRTVTIEGEHWFVAKDVADALGYKDTVNAIKQHCKGVVKRHPLQTAGGAQRVGIIREPDLYRLIVGSTLPAAQEFEAWIFEEVLPALRKTGRYAAKAHPAAGRRFIAHADEDGRLTLTELKNEIVVDPKRLARLLADPAFRLAEGGDDHRAALLEIASVAMLRANYNANVAHDLLYGDERERRVAAQRMARVASA